MSKFSINDLSDDMLKEKLNAKAIDLGISEVELIEKYVYDGLKQDFSKVDDRLSDDELIRIFSEEAENDKEIFNGKNGNFDKLISIVNSRNGY